LTQKKQKVPVCPEAIRQEDSIKPFGDFFLLDQFTSGLLFFNGLVEYAHAISQKVVKT
jgi:hypothetical protein